MGLQDVRKRAGGALIKGMLTSATHLMRLHPRARSILSEVTVERNVRYGPDDSATHILDVYRPKGVDGPLPTLLYIHGGGFRILSKNTHWMMNALFARQGFTVFSMNYRLVPDDPFPAALKDVFTAAKWIQEHGESYGADLSRWVVAGESAGANLTCALSIAHCHRRPEPWAADIFDLNLPIVAILPACGILEVTNSARFKARKPKLSTLLADRISMVCDQYVGDQGDADLASPLTILESDWTPERPYPPTMAICGTRDPILDDTRRLGSALASRGVPHEIKIYEGGIHAFHAAFWTERSTQAWEDQYAFIDTFVPDR
jgi:acetyl esterase